MKNVGDNAIEAIIAARRRGGRFGSLFDFCQRVNLKVVNRRVIESLIKCGAFDAIGETRADDGRFDIISNLGRNASATAKMARSACSMILRKRSARLPPPYPSAAEWEESQLLNRKGGHRLLYHWPSGWRATNASSAFTPSPIPKASENSRMAKKSVSAA